METISYTNSPFSDYLKETGRIEEELIVDEENYHDIVEEQEEELDSLETELDKMEESIPGSTSTIQPLPPPPPSSTVITPTAVLSSQLPPPPLISLPSIVKNNKKDQFSDRLGYALVTSSLLTPSLNDALILYPTPIRKVTPTSSSSSSPITITKSIQQPLEWGDNWESRGQIFTFINFYNFLFTIFLFLQATTKTRASSDRSSLLPSPGTPIDKSKPFSTHDLVLESIDNLVSIAQEVDLKIARALVGIREVESVGVDHTLLEHQELSVSQTTRRRPSSITMAPPSLRSFPLREHLSLKLITINENITASLASIRPTPTSLLVTPNTSPHLSTTAKLSSPIHFAPYNSTTTIPSPGFDSDLTTTTATTSTLSKRRSLTSWDESHSFGGIDRSALSSPTRRLPPPPPSPITIWETSPEILSGLIMSDSTSPGGSSSNNAAGLPQKRRRPSSLHIWSVPPTSNGNSCAGSNLNGTAATASSSFVSSSNNPPGGTLGRSASLKRYSTSKTPGEENLTSLFRSNSLRERANSRSNTPISNSSRRLSSSFDTNSLGAMMGGGGAQVDPSPTSIESLQNSFELMHSNRLILLWRLITLTDNSTTSPIVDDQEWLSIRITLEEFSNLLKGISESMTKAVENQFGKDNIGSETFLINNGRNSRLSMLSVSAESNIYTTTTSTTSNITTPITGFFPSLSIPTPLHSSSSRPNSIPSSPTRAPPSIQFFTQPIQPFAPPNPTSLLGPQATLNNFEQQTLQMSHTLRSLATKLSVVSEEISRRRSSTSTSISGSTLPVQVDKENENGLEEEEVEDLLVLHDSFRGELMRLSREWEESRITLREFINSSSSRKASLASNSNSTSAATTASTNTTSSSNQSKRNSYRPLSLSSKSPLIFIPPSIDPSPPLEPEEEEEEVGINSIYEEGPLGELSNSTTSPFKELELRRAALEDASREGMELEVNVPSFGVRDLVYEAVSSDDNDRRQRERGGFTPFNSMNGDGSGLNLNKGLPPLFKNQGNGISTPSREERIKSVKAERRKGSLLLSRSGSTSSIGMVEELKDVLELLKGRNKLGNSVGSSNGNAGD